MKRVWSLTFPSWLLGAFLVLPLLEGQDVAGIVLFKSAWYEQDSADDPVPLPAAEDPYDVSATVYLSDELLSDPDWGLWINGMTLRTPGGRTEGLMPDFDWGLFEFYDGAVSAPALNSRYAAGDYRFTLSSVISGDSVYNVPLAADDYPPAPKVTNFDAAQKIDPQEDFAVHWVDFTGGGEREIWFELFDDATFEAVFDAGPLDPDQTSLTIPAGTLVADTAYWLRLTFTRYTHLSPATVPETYSGFEAYNNLRLLAIAGGSEPETSAITGYRLLPDGDLELTATCTPDRPLTVHGATELAGLWSSLQTSTPTSSPAVLIVPRASLGERHFLRLSQE